MQVHGIGSFRLAPLNQGGQGAIKQSVAVKPDGDLPLQQALGRFATGVDDGPAINALGFPCMACILNVACIGDKVNEPR